MCLEGKTLSPRQTTLLISFSSQGGATLIFISTSKNAYVGKNLLLTKLKNIKEHKISKNTKFQFWYVPSLEESKAGWYKQDMSLFLLGPVKRPKVIPCVSSVDRIRSHFSFRTDPASANRIYRRLLSCHLVGQWRCLFIEKSLPSSGGVTKVSRHGIQSRMSKIRQEMAETAKIDDCVLLQGLEDDIFPWFPAKVILPVFKHAGKPTVTELGVRMVKGGKYLRVCFYERRPATAANLFALQAGSSRLVTISDFNSVDELALENLADTNFQQVADSGDASDCEEAVAGGKAEVNQSDTESSDDELDPSGGGRRPMDILIEYI
eukprot:g4995.t1